MTILDRIRIYLVAGILSYISIGSGYGISILNEIAHKNVANNYFIYWSETMVLPDLTRSSKKQLISIFDKTAVNLNLNIVDYGNLWKENEMNPSSFGKGYVVISKQIFRSLDLKTIIFPFHFFL